MEDLWRRSGVAARGARPLAAWPIVLATLLLTACTGASAAPSGVASLTDPGASSSPGSSPAPSGSLSPEDAMLAFARCMREHGVDMPDPQPGQKGLTFAAKPGTDMKAMDEAQQACGPIMQRAGRGPGASLSPEELDKLVKFAQCMRAHGVDMPDPQTSGGGIQIGGRDKLDPNGSTFQAATDACSSLLPGGGPKTDSGGDGAGGGPVTNTAG